MEICLHQFIPAKDSECEKCGYDPDNNKNCDKGHIKYTPINIEVVEVEDD